MPVIDIQPLKSSFHGELFEPEDAGYSDACRIWNASIQKHAALIARCSGIADIIAAVNFARENDILTAIRGGGHNVGGRALCDHGIVIDFRECVWRMLIQPNAACEFRAEPLWAIATGKRIHSVSPSRQG